MVLILIIGLFKNLSLLILYLITLDFQGKIYIIFKKYNYFIGNTAKALIKQVASNF